MIKKVNKTQRCGLLVYVGQTETRVATTQLFCQIFADYDSRLAYCTSYLELGRLRYIRSGSSYLVSMKSPEWVKTGFNIAD